MWKRKGNNLFIESINVSLSSLQDQIQALVKVYFSVWVYVFTEDAWRSVSEM